MAPSVESLRQQLAPWNQQHLLAHWDELSEVQRTGLAQQIAAIDFAELRDLFAGEHVQGDTDWRQVAQRAESPPTMQFETPPANLSDCTAIRMGEAALRAGRVAVVLVAGGQATRLGYNKPKGMFPIGPVSGATLFQIFCESVVALGRHYGHSVPLLVMTSPATHDDTVAFFEENQAFGIPQNDWRAFCQGTMPAVDAETGAVLMDSPGSIATSPDGHGGVLKALARDGLFDELRSRRIDLIFYMQVDNPLVRVCDRLFLGSHLLTKSQVSTKVVRKRRASEKLGNVAMVDGRLQVIEYSDLPDDLAQQDDAAGSPVFWAGNLALHVFDRDFLASLAEGEHQLPFHRAHKKVPYVNAEGQRVEPETPNAIKFERFIFDVLPAAERAIVLETSRQSEFAAVKNATGRDSPESVREQMTHEHRNWLRAAGVEVANDVPVEISPLFALEPAHVAKRIAPGTRITEPTVLRDT